MSLHKKMAVHAITTGKSANEFSAAAQKHANAAWVLALIAAGTWYFLDWRWALIPVAFGVLTIIKSVSSTLIATEIERLQQKPDPSGGTTPEDCNTSVVQAFGETLETSAPTPGCVADENELPYSKQEIKSALIFALRNSDDPQVSEHLKAAYISLASWQKGVGELHQGLDLSKIDPNLDIEAQAHAISAQTAGQKDWLASLQAEQNDLQRELQELDLW